MIYLRVKPRVNARVGDPLTLSDVADLLADASLGLNAIPVELPRGEGIWPLDALRLVLQIQPYAPQETVNVLGDGTGWLHREPHKRAKGRALAWADGAHSALLPAAGRGQRADNRLVPHGRKHGRRATGALYGRGRASRRARRYGLPSPTRWAFCWGHRFIISWWGREEVSPLAVKLREYSEAMEKNAGAGST